MTEPDLIPCNPPGYTRSENIDPIPPYCPDGQGGPSLHDVPGEKLSWLKEHDLVQDHDGDSALCDPVQKGHIINEQDGLPPDRTTVYRYTRSVRGCDEAMRRLFSDVVVMDEDGKAHRVPIIWGTQEKAVAAILQENFRKDDSMVVDAIRLPIMAIHNSGDELDWGRYVYHKAVNRLREEDGRPGFAVRERFDRDTVYGVSRGIPVNRSYTLYAWTLYREDMNQIYEQVVLKFSRLGYIRVRGVALEIGVSLEGIENNIETDTGDQSVAVYKYKFTLKAETYIPQPLQRTKAVLRARVEFVDTTEEVGQVIARLEEAVRGF